MRGQWPSGQRISENLTAMTGEFQQRHGFPSGANQVRPADHDDRVAARTLAQITSTRADLVIFNGITL